MIDVEKGMGSRARRHSAHVVQDCVVPYSRHPLFGRRVQLEGMGRRPNGRR